MRITNNFNTQYVSNYKKTAKQEKTDTTFVDMLNKATENTAVKSAVPIKTAGIYTAATAYSAPHKALSIYDIPRYELESRLGQAVTAASNLDTNGMTKGEIYNLVESTFADYLGKDFLELNLVYGDDTAGIFMRFHSVLQRSHDVNIYEDFDIFIEAKGYAGMSKEEMRSAIRSNYPENMTMKDVLLMEYELGRTGLETTAYAAAAKENFITSLYVSAGERANNNPAFEAEVKKMLEVMLSQPADYDRMKAHIETFRQPDGRLHFKFDISLSGSALLDHLLAWFGGTDLYSNDMIDELMKMLEGIQKN